MQLCILKLQQVEFKLLGSFYSISATGWSRSIQYFLEQNYTSGELYATSWDNTWGKNL
jgi:hypothetical protein